MIHGVVLLLCLGLAGCAGLATHCPPCAAGKASSPRPGPKRALRPPPPKPHPAPALPRLSSNCQAPLPLTEEVSRLLIKAAAHSTSSSACVDGPGERVAVDQILVCPGRVNDDRATVQVSYRVGRFPEGDTRMCGGPNRCDWSKPSHSQQQTTLQFSGKAKTLRLQLPAALPGLAGMTALDKHHKGGCYGPSGPFEARPVRLP